MSSPGVTDAVESGDPAFDDERLAAEYRQVFDADYEHSCAMQRGVRRRETELFGKPMTRLLAQPNRDLLLPEMVPWPARSTLPRLRTLIALCLTRRAAMAPRVAFLVRLAELRAPATPRPWAALTPNRVPVAVLTPTVAHQRAHATLTAAPPHAPAPTLAGPAAPA